MRLAVVTPFLNEQQLLPQLLRSIASQTRPPDRLLLVDDGSTDASPAIAAEFVRQHGYASLARRAVRAGVTFKAACPTRSARLTSLRTKSAKVRNLSGT